jgi:hypothetical protein
VFQLAADERHASIAGYSTANTELHCPWQNGRVERFFGTFKQSSTAW